MHGDTGPVLNTSPAIDVVVVCCSGARVQCLPCRCTPLLGPSHVARNSWLDWSCTNLYFDPPTPSKEAPVSGRPDSILSSILHCVWCGRAGMHVQEALGKNSGCCPTLAASISCPVLGVRVLIYVGRCDMSAQFLVLLILDSSVAYSFELNVMIHYRHISTS
jgi:hypothetical protein